MASKVREAFFRLEDPKIIAKHKWPISGKNLFVPMFNSTSWTTETITSMAKLHSRTISQLDQIFIENIFDIDRNVTFREQGGADNTRSLRDAIQSLTINGDDNIVHSAHNTNRKGVLRILVT